MAAAASRADGAGSARSASVADSVVRRIDRALLEACFEGDVDGARQALDEGARIDVADPERGGTPLMIACYNGHLGLAEVLVSRGANVHAMHTNGTTALHFVCQRGHAALVRFVLDQGADIECATDGTTPLMIACDRGTLQWLRCWCRGATCTRGCHGVTALYCACGRHASVATWLLDKGADIEAATPMAPRL
jgi:hypothetical protein